jgi:flagellar hook-associated protein 2
MASVSSLGVGAGVDLQSMLTSIITAEKAPIRTLDTKIAATNTKISLYGELRSKLDALKSASFTLESPASLGAITAKSSDATILSSSASFYATPANYNVKVEQLASAKKSFSHSYDSGTTFGQGTLNFTVGGVAQPAISLNDKASYTLAEIGAKINDAGMGVTATVISGTDGDRLVLTGEKTGASNSFSFTTDIAAPDSVPPGSTQNLLSDEDPSIALASTPARDAQIAIDGVSVTSRSNTFTDTISGLSFTALKAGDVTVSVGNDSGKIKDAVKKFVEAYNSAVTLIKENSTYDLQTKTGKGFAGDSTARSIRDALNSARTTLPDGLSGNQFQSLADLGVTIQQNGLLSVDDTVLNQSLEKSVDDVIQTVGKYGASLNSAISDLMSENGALTNRVNGLNTSVSRFKDYQAVLETRVALIEQRYRKQFTALDTLMSSMQTTSSYLTQQLKSLSG